MRLIGIASAIGSNVTPTAVALRLYGAIAKGKGVNGQDTMMTRKYPANEG